MGKIRPTDDIFERLAAAEDGFLHSTFLAPVVRGHGVRVQIGGVACQLDVDPAEFSGWGVFRPRSHSRAALIRLASMVERHAYLKLLPTVRLILCEQDRERWLALPAQPGGPVAPDQAVPVQQVEADAQLFESVIARFDGAWFWSQGADPRGDPRTSAHLRSALVERADPAEVRRKGMTGAERRAYAWVHARAVGREREARDRADSGRLAAALRHGGAHLKDFERLADGDFRVAYTVDGRRHMSIVSHRDLSVRTAGICLSGQDGKFDLQSLVGVLREGARR